MFEWCTIEEALDEVQRYQSRKYFWLMTALGLLTINLTYINAHYNKLMTVFKDAESLPIKYKA